MTLKAIIFDFGGVLVRTHDHSLREKWERRLGLAPGQAAEIVFDSEVGRAAQLGHISDAEHWRWLQHRLGLDDEALVRFRAEFFDGDRLDADLLAYVDRLRERYTVGLLSNATPIGRQVFSEEYPLIDHFDSVTISAEEGVMKPEPRIYHIALERAGVEPQQALFVDDLIQNVEGARRVGMQAIHFVDPLAVRLQLIALTKIH